jgi:hypothetical protein
MHFTIKEMQECADAHGIHEFSYVTHLSEAPSLIKRWNDLLKTQLQHQLSGIILQG